MAKTLADPRPQVRASRKELAFKVPVEPKKESSPAEVTDDTKLFEQEPITFITQDDLDPAVFDKTVLLKKMPDVHADPASTVLSGDIAALASGTDVVKDDDATKLVDPLDVIDDKVDEAPAPEDTGMGDMRGIEVDPEELGFPLAKDKAEDVKDEAPEAEPEAAPEVEEPEGKPKSKKKLIIGLAAGVAVAVVGVVGLVWALTGGFKAPSQKGVTATTPPITEPVDTKKEQMTPVVGSDGQESKATGEAYSTVQVAELVKDLTFDGTKVSVTTEGLTLSTKDGHVLVKEPSAPTDGGYGAAVQNAVSACAALATELKGDTIEGKPAQRVTWALQDGEGKTHFVVTDSTESAPDTGNFVALLSASGGYELDDAWLEHVRQELVLANLANKGGLKPTDLEGKDFGVISQATGEAPAAPVDTSDGEPSVDGTATIDGDGNTQAVDEPASESASSGEDTPSGSGGSVAQTPDSNFGAQSGSGGTSQGSGGNSTSVTRPSTGGNQSSQGGGSASSGTVSTPDSNYGASQGNGGHSAPTTNRRWVADYEDVEVRKPVQKDVIVYVCGCGQTFETEAEAKAHQAAVKAADPNHSSTVSPRKTTKTVYDTVIESRPTGTGHWEYY